MRTLALRLKPGEDLKRALTKVVALEDVQAGVVLTCVGSLSRAALRLADRDEKSLFEGPFEILALSGTLSPEGLHLHVALADKDGATLGGHVLGGCVVYTTAEIVLGFLQNVAFYRQPDAETGYAELVVDASLVRRFAVLRAHPL